MTFVCFLDILPIQLDLLDGLKFGGFGFLPLHSHSKSYFFLHFLVLQLTEWDAIEEGKEVIQQWEDDWDDDDVSDDFSVQLRRELESTTEKN
jgi:hypothetical protein